jgi:hypothetical protein
MRDIQDIRDPVWSQFHRLMRSHNLNGSEMLLKLMENEKEKETMQKEVEDLGPLNEIKNNKLDEQLLRLSEIKEDIHATKADLLDKLKKLEDLESRLIPQHLKETNSKLDILTLNLRTVNEKLTEITLPQPEPILTPELIKTLTELKERWQSKDLTEVVKNLIYSYEHN